MAAEGDCGTDLPGDRWAPLHHHAHSPRAEGTEHRAKRKWEFALDTEEVGQPILGRFVSRGLDDELKGTAYAIVDGIAGRTHEVRLPDLDATGNAAPGAIGEMRRFEDAAGRQRVAIAVHSDFGLAAQVRAQGAT
jgi:hypothetical protein